MAEEKKAETKIVKGGFRSTLALIISIIAILLSIAAYSSTAREKELSAGISELQRSLEVMKKESLAEIDKLRKETANLLERLKDAVEKKEERREKQQG
jgi:hypothetical protein